MSRKTDYKTCGEYYGGPWDGHIVYLWCSLIPNRIWRDAWLGGYYVRDGQRYRWVQG